MANTNNDKPNIEELRKAYPPNAVAFYDENYTFSDRERDLLLMETLMLDKLSNTRMELGLLRRTIHTGEYLQQISHSTDDRPSESIELDHEKLES